MDLEREETENKVELQRENIGDIKFENVSFRYGSRTEVFKNFNAVFKRMRLLPSLAKAEVVKLL
jgi:ATP-binding cassette subfamily B protein